MEDRFIETTQYGSYVLAPWTGTNTAGFRPVCDRVLVLPDQAMDMTAGGIIIPDMVQDTLGAAAMTGILVAIGPQAFAYDSERLVRWEGERPQPGTRVWFQKFAGQEYQGRDGLLYRCMQDKLIGLIEDVPPQEEQF